MATDTRIITAYIDGLPGSERQVEATVPSDAPNRAYIEARVLVRFRTGTKVHSDRPMGWVQADGRVKINRHTVIHNRSCKITGWMDDRSQANSGWTGNAKKAPVGDQAPVGDHGSAGMADCLLPPGF